MSVSRHHAEWLSLVEAQGAFLSIEELLKVFPQGLDAHEPEHFNLLKLAYDEWSYEKFNPEIHRAWIDWVLENTLEFPAGFTQATDCPCFDGEGGAVWGKFDSRRGFGRTRHG